MAFGQPSGESLKYLLRWRMPARTRKCHVSRLRLRGRRLTGTSGRGLPFLAAWLLPSSLAFPAPPALLHILSSQALSWPPVGWGECGARPRACCTALSPPRLSPKSLALPLRFEQSSFSSSLGAVADPYQPGKPPSSCPSRGCRPPAVP